MVQTPSRRTFLSGSLAVGVGLSGCGSLSMPDFRHRYTSYREGALITNAPGLANNGFYSTVVTSSDDAAAVDWSVLPASEREEFADVDYDESFLAILLSCRALTPPGAVEGDRPRSTVEGDTFVFEFDGSEWPPTIESGEVLTVVERWTAKSPPPSASEVRISYGNDR